MASGSVRTRKVASLLQREIADIIRNEVRDPRLQKFPMVTVSGIDLAPDHRNATVFVSFMGQDQSIEDREAGIAALKKASGFIRGKILKRVEFKVVPMLVFRYDSSFEYADQIHRALKKIQE